MDLSVEAAPVFTKQDSFYLYFSSLVRPDSNIDISTYNIGISEYSNAFLETFFGRLSKARSIRLLVGRNPFHHQNPEYDRILRHFAKKHATLEIRILQGVHGKYFCCDNFQFLGSLNLGAPLLHDLMCEAPQHPMTKGILDGWFTTLWDRAGKSQHLTPTSEPASPVMLKQLLKPRREP